MIKTEWWREFFSGLALEMWRTAISENQTQMEATFINEQLHLTPLAKVLDVPCGDGRLAIELASRGFELIGVDISSGFLKEARSRAAKLGVNVVWEHREMRDLPWNEGFDGAFCFGNSFGFLDDEGNAGFLKRIHHVLKPGMRFILDASSVAELVVPKIQSHTEVMIGEIQFVEDNRYDHAQGRLDTDYTFLLKDRVEKKFGSHRLYTYRELCRLLEAAGFVIRETFGTLSREPFRLGSPGLYFVAARH